jgi:hypothetical protein
MKTIGIPSIKLTINSIIARMKEKNNNLQEDKANEQ